MEKFDFDYPERPKKSKRKVHKFKDDYDAEFIKRKKKLRKKRKVKKNYDSDL